MLQFNKDEMRQVRRFSDRGWVWQNKTLLPKALSQLKFPMFDGVTPLVIVVLKTTLSEQQLPVFNKSNAANRYSLTHSPERD